VQGVFFLRKKTLGILLSLYNNWQNAIAPAVFQGMHPKQGLKPASFEGILARLKSGPVTRLPPERVFCSLHNTQDFWRTTLTSSKSILFDDQEAGCPGSRFWTRESMESCGG
jgi:hypothetical protein